MISVVPGIIPVTIPLDEPMPATPGEPELHVPPPASNNVVVDPTHVTAMPVTGAGIGTTVTVVAIAHPVGKVYVISPMPDDAPKTTPPDEPTVVTDIVPELHVPPVTESVSVVVLPMQTCLVPVITDGNGFTVTCTIVVSNEPEQSTTITLKESAPLNPVTGT